MKKKIIWTILICTSIFLLGMLLKNIIGGTNFEDLSPRDQEILNEINEIYEKTRVDEKGKVSLIVSPVNEERESTSKSSYIIGRPKAFYYIFAKPIKLSKEMALPALYQIDYFAKSILCTLFVSHFTFVDIGADYTFYYKIE